MNAPANLQHEPVAEHEPTYRLNEKIRRARQRMGEERWAKLNAEWAQ